MMKKIMFLLFFLLCPIIVFALSVQKDGFHSLGKVSVQLIPERLTLDYAEENGYINLPPEFAIYTNRYYTDEEMEDGTYDRERNDPTVVTYGSTVNREKVIVFKPSLTSTGIIVLPGTIQLKFNNAAVMVDGTECDVSIVISNIIIRNNHTTTRPLGILRNTLSHIIYYARQEHPGNEIDNTAGYIVGANYTFTVRITKAGTNYPVEGTTAVSFLDLDQPDLFNGNYSYGQNYLWSEGITFVDGFLDPIHLTTDSVLQSEEVSGNLALFGSRRTANEEMDKSGFVALVEASEYTYIWSGTNGGTTINYLPTRTVTVNGYGSNQNKIIATGSNNFVFWKQDVPIEVEAKKGYYIDRIKVDGEELTINKKKEEHIFRNVIDNHEFLASAAPIPYQVHYNANGGTGDMASTNAKYDEEKTLAKNTFVREGYSFVGWKAFILVNNEKTELKDQNGNQLIFNDEAKFVNLLGDNLEGVTLYAEWVKDEQPVNPPTDPTEPTEPKETDEVPETGAFISIGLLIVSVLVGLVVYYISLRRRPIKKL